MQLKFKSMFDRTFISRLFRLLFSEDDFKTDVDLRVACLILDKQVKLINGNEANILIANVWLTKYLADQGKGIVRQEPAVEPTVEVQSTYQNLFLRFSQQYFRFFSELEAPKIVIQTITPRPRIMPKTGMILTESLILSN